MNKQLTYPNENYEVVLSDLTGEKGNHMFYNRSVIYPNNQDSLKMAYFYLKTLEELDTKSNHIIRTIKDQKQAIRRYTKRDFLDNINFVFQYIVGDTDWAIYKAQLMCPKNSTYKKAKEAFMEYCYIPCPESIYDCTGEPFTSNYKIFRKSDGSWWCYHIVSYDD